MKHFKLIILFIATGVFLAGCIKNDGPVYDAQAQIEKEVPLIESYVDSINETGEVLLVKDDEMFIWSQYEPAIPGEPEDPENPEDPEEEGPYEYTDANGQLRWPTIKVKYTGRLLDGTIFDEEEEESDFMALKNLVPSWSVAFFPRAQGGLTEDGLQVGDKVRFIMPSYWGYGPNSREGIPANSPLDFEIEVLAINAPGGPLN